MPDYNPAVALGVKPPENSLASTFNTIANIQQSQAHAGLYTLEEAKLARENNAMLAGAAAYNSNQDAAGAVLGAGGNPTIAKGFQDIDYARSAARLTGLNVPPSSALDLARTRQSLAETGKIGEETKKVRTEAETAGLGLSKAQDEQAMRSSGMYLADPDAPGADQHLADAMRAHIKAHPPANDVEAAYQQKMMELVLKAPREQKTAIARGYGSIEPTEAQRNAMASGETSALGYETKKKIADTDVATYGKVLQGLSGSANTATAIMPNIQMAKALINDPSFYSGTAESINLAFKKAAVAVGAANEDLAVPQDAFRKVMAANILHQIDDIKAASAEMGSNTSRIFASQIDLMEKAAQNPNNTIAANRFLVEVQERAALRSIKMGDMAAEYKRKNGMLDEGFVKDLRKWSLDNPMFTKEELSNPKLLARPPAKTAAAMPKIGEIRQGFAFTGGDPADPNSWAKK